MAQHNTTTKAGKKIILGSGLCEKIAREILKGVNEKYYFLADTGDYDIISEEGRRVEVKSILHKQTLKNASYSYNTNNQKYSDRFLILIDDTNMKKGELIIRWQYKKKPFKNVPLNRKNLDLSDPVDYIEFKRIMKKKGINITEPEKEKVTFCNCRNCGSSNFSMGENDRGEKIVFCSKCKEYYGNLEREKK
jgi:hypothetical protein